MHKKDGLQFLVIENINFMSYFLIILSVSLAEVIQILKPCYKRMTRTLILPAYS